MVEVDGKLYRTPEDLCTLKLKCELCGRVWPTLKLWELHFYDHIWAVYDKEHEPNFRDEYNPAFWELGQLLCYSDEWFRGVRLLACPVCCSDKPGVNFDYEGMIKWAKQLRDEDEKRHKRKDV